VVDVNAGCRISSDQATLWTGRPDVKNGRRTHGEGAAGSIIYWPAGPLLLLSVSLLRPAIDVVEAPSAAGLASWHGPDQRIAGACTWDMIYIALRATLRELEKINPKMMYCRLC
jgi:hypothetical protein